MPTVRAISPRVSDDDDLGLIDELKAKARALRAEDIELLDDSSWEALELRKRLKGVERERADRSLHDPDCSLTTTRISGVLVDTFWALVKHSDTCWLWWLGPSEQERGRFRHPDVAFIGSWACRATYLIARGQIPEGKDARHRCANALCVNPDHLMLGDHWESMLDIAVRKELGIAAPEVFTYEDDLERARLPSAGSGLRAAHVVCDRGAGGAYPRPSCRTDRWLIYICPKDEVS
jgi:hypothetical protein